MGLSYHYNSYLVLGSKAGIHRQLNCRKVKDRKVNVYEPLLQAVNRGQPYPPGIVRNPLSRNRRNFYSP